MSFFIFITAVKIVSIYEGVISNEIYFFNFFMIIFDFLYEYEIYFFLFIFYFSFTSVSTLRILYVFAFQMKKIFFIIIVSKISGAILRKKYSKHLIA